MTGTRARFTCIFRQLGICIAIAAALSVNIRSAHAVIKVFDGFGDADRNNDGLINGYDTDINDSGTFNDFTGTPPTATGPDSGLANRGITEVTAAQDPSDVGIVWSGSRSYDTMIDQPKAKLRIINDSVATGSETSANIHNHGLALGVESRGGGSSLIGNFGQSIALGPVAGDKLAASVNFRSWNEANNAFTAPIINEIRWGLYQDTDAELGTTAPQGAGWFANPGHVGASVTWGRDDGNWFNAQPGAEGDKSIQASNEFGSNFAAPTNARIRWEYNQAGINGTANDGRILEGNGVSNTPGTGGDTGTIATPTTNGPGGIFNDTSIAPHNLKIEITRLANGLANVAYFIDNSMILSDDIKTTDTGYSLFNPTSFSFDHFDYVAFRDTADFDYVLDDFKVEVFGSNAGVAGDYNNDGTVNAADYVLWRKGGPLANEVADVGTISAADYTEWRARFGNPAGSGASLGSGAVPEPSTVWMLLMGAIAWKGCARRRSA